MGILTSPFYIDPLGLHETLALLTSQLRPDSNHKEEMIHEKLCHYEQHSPVPVLHSASALAEDVIEELQTAPMNNDEKELLQLLSTPHLRAMLVVHDTVAQKNFDPVLPPLLDNIDDDFDEESVKIVRLVKNKEPLGATIRRDEHTGAVIVARIMRGGAADRSGLVHVGDELREVNGIAVLHKRPEEISQILPQLNGTLDGTNSYLLFDAGFAVEKAGIKEEDRLKDSKVFMRALFSYNPKEDKAIPCQEAGLPFQRRHILEVVSQDDPTWWQAKRVGDTNLRAGLIPSKQFQESGFDERFRLPEDCDCEGYFNGQYIAFHNTLNKTEKKSITFGLLAGLRRSFRLSRKEKQSDPNETKQSEQNSTPELLTYEEVIKYQQQPGSLGSRLNELKQKVVAENPQEYGVAVPHTTRTKKSHEKEGVEYNFVSKQSFEIDIQHNKFVEHGEYKENLYGTSLEAIQSVMSKNKVCLVDVVPEAVKHLRTAEFKPHVVFVKPLVSEKKKNTPASLLTEDIFVPLDEEQQEMVNSAAFIEEQYGHLIDTVLVKEDLQSACSQLKTILEKLNSDCFWVPVSWVKL
ncbi:MAGUK p55 subfamily member 3, partial [Ophiophagus hannah]